VRPLPRLRRSAETRFKIAMTLRGRKRSEETKEKIRASLKGRKHTPEAIEKMRVAHSRRGRTCPEKVLAECRAAARERHDRIDNVRHERWKLDMAAAMSRPRLYRDVMQSQGWHWKRKLHDETGEVSDGITVEGEIVWKGNDGKSEH
jgi:hypothetical protein